MESHRLGDRLSVEAQRGLQAGRSVGGEQVLGPDTVLSGLVHQCPVVLPAACGSGCGFLEDLVGVRPVESLEPHSPGDLSEDPPVGAGVTRCVHEALVEAYAPFGVCPREILLAPRRGGENQVGVPGALVGIDLLMDQHHSAGVDPLDEVGDDGIRVG